MSRGRTFFLFCIGALAGCQNCQSPEQVQTDAGGDGGCSPPCEGGLACVASACVDPCVLAGQMRCDGGCIDPIGDSENCGGCGIVCQIGQSCQSANCVGGCPVGQTACADAGCVDLQGNREHCGTCTTACDPSESCLDGRCQSGLCASPFLICGSGASQICVDPRNDPDNCGDCGVTCGPNGTCVTGACACFSRAANCGLDGGVFCPDLTSDPQNCGGCQAACLRCEACSISTCRTEAPRAGVPLPFPAGLSRFGVSDLIGGDFNGDGVPDLAAVGYVALPSSDWGLVWWSGQQDGSFRGGPSFVPDAGLTAVIAKVGDFNGDGIDDLAVLLNPFGTSTRPSQVSVLSGSRGSGFSQSLEAIVPDAGYGWDLAVADVNGDGRPDIVALTSGAGFQLLGDLFINDGDGGFSLTAQVPVLGGLTDRLGIADLNQDGLPDLVVGGSGSIGIDFQLADGGFNMTLASGLMPDTEQVLGFDSFGPSGRQLLVTFPDGIELLVGAPGGPTAVGDTFTAASLFLFSGSAIADLNGDGTLDVASAGANLGIFLGRDGGFDFGLSDAGLGGYVAAVPGDGGTRIASVETSGANPSGTVVVSTLPCP